MDSSPTVLGAYFLEHCSVPRATVAKLAGIEEHRIDEIAQGDNATAFEQSALEMIFLAGFTWPQLSAPYFGKEKILRALDSSLRQFCETRIAARRLFG